MKRPPIHQSEGRPMKDNKGNNMPWMVCGYIEIKGESITSGVIAWCFSEEDAKLQEEKIREHYRLFGALCHLYIEGVEAQLDGFSVAQKSAFPPGNAFHHDSYNNMGQQIGVTKTGERIMLMHANHSTNVCEAFVVVNEKTGKRIRVSIQMD